MFTDRTPDPAAERRRRAIARARRLRDDGFIDEANRVLLAAAGPPGPPRDPEPGRVPRSEPEPVRAAPRDLKAAERARKAIPIAGSAAAVEASRSRKVAHVIAILHDTCENEPGMPVGPDGKAAPILSNAGRVPWQGTFGRMLGAELAADPALTSYEAAAAVLGEVRRLHRPIKLTKAKFAELVGAARRGPARGVEITDMSVAGGRVTVWLGEMRHRPTIEQESST